MASENVLKQMSGPTRTLVKILDENWPRIRRSCNYYEEGKECPKTGEDCKFDLCPLLEEAEEDEGVVEDVKSSP